MAPSRGIHTLVRQQRLSRLQPLRRTFSSFVKNATDPSRKCQVYISRSNDPYLNLSIEHFLLQKTPPESTILFLYTNRQCVVIGRNQNPWVEVNLGLLVDERPDPGWFGNVDLVRRRSGGGTVFHDLGNVNYSVICPTSAFHRDIHAQMVVRALRGLGVTKAKVNERHDIVIDPRQDQLKQSHSDILLDKPLKISGSAYKLTRLRSLHHGTCLLSSPNIGLISSYLRSPAKPYIKARGVDSVNSPIANVNVSNEAFENAVVAEFGKMYNPTEPTIVTDSLGDVPEIEKGLKELTSKEWIFSQTPQFTFSTHKTPEDPRERPTASESTYVREDLYLNFTARNGAITEANMSLADINFDEALSKAVVGVQLHTIEDWYTVLPNELDDRDAEHLGTWLNVTLGKTTQK